MKFLGMRQFTQGVLGTEPECFALAGLLNWTAQTLRSGSSSRLLSKHGSHRSRWGSGSRETYYIPK